MPNLINITIKNHIAHVELNRPEKMNALSLEMFDAIIDAGRSLAENRDVRVVVLSGAGKAFCAGLDLANFTDPKAFEDPFGEGKGGFWPNHYQLPGYVWKQMPVPVIAALHGVAFGGGIQIALGADIRIAHPESRLSVMEIKWGLIPDMSGSQTLRDLVRLDVAKELCFTGRIVEGQEAEQIGLVTRLAEDPLAKAMELAETIAGKNPDAISLGKYLLDNSRDGDRLAGLKMEEKLQARLMKSPNQIEAVMAAMQKRSPQFDPRTIKNFDELESL